MNDDELCGCAAGAAAAAVATTRQCVHMCASRVGNAAAVVTIAAVTAAATPPAHPNSMNAPRVLCVGWLVLVVACAWCAVHDVIAH